MELEGKALCQRQKTNDAALDRRLSPRLSLPAHETHHPYRMMNFQYIRHQGDFHQISDAVHCPVTTQQNPQDDFWMHYVAFLEFR